MTETQFHTMPDGRRLEYDYDGAGGLSLGPVETVAQPNRGGGVVQVNGLVYVTGGGVVVKIPLVPLTGQRLRNR